VASVTDDVILVLGERRLRLTMVEANEIYGRSVTSGLQVRTLHSELKRVKRSDSGKGEVDVTEQMRQELLLILDAIKTADLMTPGLRELRGAASTPLS
jgi:hypothetical protein